MWIEAAMKHQMNTNQEILLRAAASLKTDREVVLLVADSRRLGLLKDLKASDSFAFGYPTEDVLRAVAVDIDKVKQREADDMGYGGPVYFNCNSLR